MQGGDALTREEGAPSVGCGKLYRIRLRQRRQEEESECHHRPTLTPPQSLGEGKTLTKNAFIAARSLRQRRQVSMDVKCQT
jgi:hypothetical protein